MLTGTRFRTPTVFMATSRLPLQSPLTVDGDAGTSSSSRNKLITRLHFPQPHKWLVGGMEEWPLGSDSYKSRLVSNDIPCLFSVQTLFDFTDSLNRQSFPLVF